MKNNIALTTGLALAVCTGMLRADSPNPGAVPAVNNAPTAAYGNSSVTTWLNVDIKDGVKNVRFIRDNTDPYVITKAYLLKHADPYALRGALLGIVRGTIKDNPVSVDALKYNDGTGILIVSAEDYRFSDAGNGMSIDAIVGRLDSQALPYSPSRTPFIYYPKANYASVMASMLRKSGLGMAYADGVEFTRDPVNGLNMRNTFSYTVDTGLNAIVLNATEWDIATAKSVLKEIDAPACQARITYKLLEVYAENDQKLGVDFQAWKNNDGLDFFSTGGRYASNWANTFGGKLTPNNGYNFREFFNFNPKWNTKYLDFLTVNGKAKVVSSGTVLVMDGDTARLRTGSGLFTVVPEAVTKTLGESMPSDAAGKFYADLLATIPASVLGMNNVEGNKISVDPVENASFFLDITFSPVVTGSATTLNVALDNCSLIGWTAAGDARTGNTHVEAAVQVGFEKKDFVIGGVTKSSLVRGTTGIPFLKDIPFLGWVFSTESESIKKSQFVLIASVEAGAPSDKLGEAYRADIGKLTEAVKKAEANPVSALGFEQLLIDTNRIE
ncbi:MAG: hypothetical protein PHI35_01925 [Victivallaceae bacterium]|nr:hypothetical protein [Victivallaceae bacterium]